MKSIKNFIPVSHDTTLLVSILHYEVATISSDTSFKKTFCLMNIRPQDQLSHETRQMQIDEDACIRN